MKFELPPYLALNWTVNQKEFIGLRPHKYGGMLIKHATQIVKKIRIRRHLCGMIELGQKLERGVKHANMVQK
jgi:hypothetical protein